MIEDAQANKASIILFTKLDRWFRSIEDYYEVMSQIPNSVPWSAIWEDYETVTSAGRFKVNIMLSIAQAEAERTSERIRNTFDYKRAKGDYIGSAPIGYKRENNKLVKDQETAPIVEMVFDTYLKTHSTSKARRKVNETGRFISKSCVEKILRSETYAGNAYGYQCEPYISRETYDEIQRIKLSNYREPKEKCKALFSSIVYCGFCDTRMRAVNSQRNGVHYPNYYCNPINKGSKHTNGISFSEMKLEKYLLRELDQLIGEHNIQATTQGRSEEQTEQDKKKKALEAKLERIGIRFEEGDISSEEYKEKRKAILSEIASLKSIKRAEKIDLPDNWHDIYISLDFSHKQEFWFSIIEKILIFRDSEGDRLQVIFKD